MKHISLLVLCLLCMIQPEGTTMEGLGILLLAIGALYVIEYASLKLFFRGEKGADKVQ